MAATKAIPRADIRTGSYLVVLAGVLILLAVYLYAFDLRIRPFHLYPLIWIAIGLSVLWYVRPTPDERRNLGAAILAAVYFVVLLIAGGVVGAGPELPLGVVGDTATGIYDLRFVTAVPPGYGPALLYVGPYLRIGLIPYLLVGYLALAWLVYVTALTARRAATPGLLGIFACIGCTWPVLAAVLGGSTGIVSSVGAAVYANAYPVSTAAFVFAVGLLWATLRRLRADD